MFLDLERDRVEIVSSLLQNSSSIVVPEEPKVCLDAIPQIDWNIGGASLGLILNLLDQHEPGLELVLVVIEI